MADTIRDRTAILALLADNTTQDISPQDLRDFLVSSWGLYGSLYVKDGSTAQGSLSTTPAKLTAFAADGPANGVTVAHATDTITIGANGDGTYGVLFFASFSGSINTLFSFALRKGGVEQNLMCERKIGTGGDIGTTGFFGLVDSLAAADDLTIYVEADGAAKSITVTQAWFTVFRIY